MKSTIFACAILVSAVTAAWAQHEHSPYAGQETRSIKALSPAEVSELLNGAGMGLAKAAELNGYPGPKHVLELAEPLNLTAAQVASTEAIFRRMNLRARELGARIVEREQALDGMFASGSVKSEALGTELEQIGALQAELRSVHLDAHLSQVAVLTPEQMSHYRQLRGYEAASREQRHRH